LFNFNFLNSSTMRKTYLMPATEVVEVEMESQILSGSGGSGGSGGGGGSSSNGVSAKRNGYSNGLW
jgi:hypothetical protein